LYYGQAFTNKELIGGNARHKILVAALILSFTDATVQEEKELILALPFIPPYSSSFYSFPEVDATFPEIQNPGSIEMKLHLGGHCPAEDNVSWSGAIDLSTEHALFAQIAGVSDIKVQVAKEGNTTHVYVEPVTRAEVPAKEIRSRLRGGKESVRLETVPVNTATSAIAKEKEKEELAEEQRKRERYLDINLLCSQVTLVLLDDVHHNRNIFSEMLCVTAENVGFSCYPKLDIAQSTSAKPKYDQNMVFCIGDIQVDNQLYGSANYDFPVLLMASPSQKSNPLQEIQFGSFSLEEKLGILMNHGILCISFGFYKDTKQNVLTLQTAKLTIKPLQVFVEDVFVYELLKEFDRLLPTRILNNPSELLTGRLLPQVVCTTAMALNHPIRLENICIEPIEMLVSLHASLKVFLASDNTPLKFKRYERTLYTTPQQLARSLTMHFASGAFFRAGMSLASAPYL
jgi:vacuolar protein sorting-associated protein 13B